MKAALLSKQPLPVPIVNAAESSESGKPKFKNKRSMSDDAVAEKGHDQSSIQPIEMPHVGVRRGGTTTKTRFGSRIPGRPFRNEGVKPVAFELPHPALRKSPSASAHYSRHAARQEDPKDSELIPCVPGEPKPIPCANVRTPVSVVPLSLGKVGDIEAARKEPTSLCRPHTASQNPPSPSFSGNSKEKREKVSKSRTSHICQTVVKSRPEATESSSSIIKIQKEEMLYVTAESPHHAGRTWRPLPVKPIGVPPLPPLLYKNDQVRRSWSILHETTSTDDAWNAYTTLNELNVPVRLAALHRMVRLVARDRPRASTEYTRLLEILRRVRSTGGKVYLHEWNTLIDAAGRGWRKTTVRHYETALSFFRDMTKGHAPGTTLALDVGSAPVEDEITAEPVEPDIYTYTTLLGIAARTRDQKCLRHARILFERSGIPPNRFTHLALMPYFAATSQPGAVRSTLLMLERERMDLGLDGINALLWSYSKNRRLDIVTMIYRLLKHNLTPDLDDVEEETKRLEEYRCQLRTEEFIVVPDDLVPNEITYTTLIQIMAYHGHLSGALTIFADMLSAPNTERGASLTRDSDGVLKPSLYQPTAAIFRALFLGFRRHAKPDKDGSGDRLKRDADSANEWTLSNLQQVFDLFMSMPATIQAGSSAVYWLIVAFQITSNDKELIRDVWRRVEGRFGRFTMGPSSRLYKLRTWLFLDTD
ncbi:hypothetical protein C0993_008265 [Termitomyces sp. T159_Od127]|nr:hypothetical protein C0993_008265 [Termitomyces sp. T159_Od127]